MKITVLGSGTSQGVPIITCDCEVCHSSDPKDRRLRTSILVETDSTTICIDAGPDFRYQMLRANVKKLDAILITHEHKDHIGGLDDARPLIFVQKKPMTVYASLEAQEEIRREYSYAFANEDERYPGAPAFELIDINNEPIKINDLTIEPIKLKHFTLTSYGFRIGNFAYITDLSELSDEAFQKLFTRVYGGWIDMLRGAIFTARIRKCGRSFGRRIIGRGEYAVNLSWHIVDGLGGIRQNRQARRRRLDCSDYGLCE